MNNSHNSDNLRIDDSVKKAIGINANLTNASVPQFRHNRTDFGEGFQTSGSLNNAYHNLFGIGG